MTKVACVGIAVQDVIFSLEGLPHKPGKYHALQSQKVGGGVAANAAVAVARLGGEAAYVGALGDDSAGDTILTDLAAEGIDIASVRRVAGVTSPHSAVLVEATGERIIVNHTHPGLFDQATPIDSGDLEGADAVLVDVRWLVGGAFALNWAKERSLPAVLDFDVSNDSAPELIPLASHVLFSADALRMLTGMNDLGEALTNVTAASDGWVGVTAGAEGTFWVEDGALVRQAAFDVEVVDTTGAGDVFHGAMALHLAHREAAIRDALRFASAAAALTCRTFGGRSGIPTARQVDDFLAERP